MRAATCKGLEGEASGRRPRKEPDDEVLVGPGRVELDRVPRADALAEQFGTRQMLNVAALGAMLAKRPFLTITAVAQAQTAP